MSAILYSWPQRICREKSRTPQHHYLIWPRWKCCSVVGQCYERHRHDELLRFLRRLDHEFPGKIGLHLVLDNYIAHKHPNVRAWLERHSRFVCRYFFHASEHRANVFHRLAARCTELESYVGMQGHRNIAVAASSGRAVWVDAVVSEIAADGTAMGATKWCAGNVSLSDMMTEESSSRLGDQAPLCACRRPKPVSGSPLCGAAYRGP